MISQPKTRKILEVVDEAKDVKTFYIEGELDAKPGQYVMMWIPRVNEKPISVSYQDENKFGLTILKVGPFTGMLHKMKESELIGIRGPLGNPFNLYGKRILIIGGGVGIPPLDFLASEALKQNMNIDFIQGAKTKEMLIPLKAKVNPLICTDDGSAGKQGFTTEMMKDLDLREYDCVYTCGPEVMMSKILEQCNNAGVDCQISMERYMKCGMGVCGQCAVDPLGLTVCRDGPVFDRKTANQITEFNKYKRNAFGQREDL